MSFTAKLFMSGRSQAIRLPARLRLEASEVRVEQIGNALWVQAEVSAQQDMGEWLRSFYETHEPLPESFLADRNDPLPQMRDWS